MLRIGLNLLHALPEIGGGWNYIANLIAAIANCDDRNQYVAFVSPHSETLVPGQANFTTVMVRIDTRRRVRRILYEYTGLQIQAIRHKLDCMHWFGNTTALWNAVPAAVTVYDLLPFVGAGLPYGGSKAKVRYLRWAVARSARTASILLPMSQSTGTELTRLFAVDAGRIVVVPTILNPEYRVRSQAETAAIRVRYGLPEKFWLYVAHFYPHKNHARLVAAYAQLLAAGHRPWKLVLRGDPKGAEGEVAEKIAAAGLGEEILFLPRLEESELAAIYTAAGGLIYPSLYEGGAIPILEAAGCGCPVIVAEIPVAVELLGMAATYFDPTAVDAIANAMLNFENAGTAQAVHRSAGLSCAEKHRPEAVVGNLLHAYSQIVRR